MTKAFADNQSGGSSSTGGDEAAAILLQVPHVSFGAQRSRSVESGSIDLSAMASYLEVPKRFQRRRSSSTKSPYYCVHCLCVDEYERLIEAGKIMAPLTTNATTIYGDSDESLSDDDDDETDDSEHTTSKFLTIPLIVPQCNINVSLASNDTSDLQSAAGAGGGGGDCCDETFVASTNDPTCDTIAANTQYDNDTSMAIPQRSRRRSISRQEAIFVEPTGSSLENLDSMKTVSGGTGGGGGGVNELSPRLRRNNEHSSVASNDSSDYVQDFFLTVPETDLRRDRAASVDSSFSKLSSNGITEELQPQIDGYLAVPTNAVRSRSVDIVLPTDEQARYKAISLAAPSTSKRYVLHLFSVLCDLFHSVFLCACVYASISDHRHFFYSPYLFLGLDSLLCMPNNTFYSLLIFGEYHKYRHVHFLLSPLCKVSKRRSD